MSTPSLKELLAKQNEISAAVESARQREREEELPRLRALVVDYRLTADELFGKPSGLRRGPKVKKPGDTSQRNSPLGLSRGVAKYKDPASNRTWSGFGRRPDWFIQDQADSFLIPA